MDKIQAINGAKAEAMAMELGLTVAKSWKMKDATVALDARRVVELCMS